MLYKHFRFTSCSIIRTQLNSSYISYMYFPILISSHAHIATQEKIIWHYNDQKTFKVKIKNQPYNHNRHNSIYNWFRSNTIQILIKGSYSQVMNRNCFCIHHHMRVSLNLPSHHTNTSQRLFRQKQQHVYIHLYCTSKSPASLCTWKNTSAHSSHKRHFAWV